MRTSMNKDVTRKFKQIASELVHLQSNYIIVNNIKPGRNPNNFHTASGVI